MNGRVAAYFNGVRDIPHQTPRTKLHARLALGLWVWDLGFGIWFLFGTCDL